VKTALLTPDDAPDPDDIAQQAVQIARASGTTTLNDYRISIGVRPSGPDTLPLREMP